MALPEGSDFGGIWNFSEDVEDTEVYQEIIRMSYETFYEILQLMARLVILPFAISVWVSFW